MGEDIKTGSLYVYHSRAGDTEFHFADAPISASPKRETLLTASQLEDIRTGRIRLVSEMNYVSGLRLAQKLHEREREIQVLKASLEHEQLARVLERTPDSIDELAGHIRKWIQSLADCGPCDFTYALQTAFGSAPISIKSPIYATPNAGPRQRDEDEVVSNTGQILTPAPPTRSDVHTMIQDYHRGLHLGVNQGRLAIVHDSYESGSADEDDWSDELACKDIVHGALGGEDE